MRCITAWAAGDRQIFPKQTNSTLYFPVSLILKVQYYKKSHKFDALGDGFYIILSIFAFSEERRSLDIKKENGFLFGSPLDLHYLC
jgi:hypothetical protein